MEDLDAARGGGCTRPLNLALTYGGYIWRLRMALTRTCKLVKAEHTTQAAHRRTELPHVANNVIEANDPVAADFAARQRAGAATGGVVVGIAGHVPTFKGMLVEAEQSENDISIQSNLSESANGG